MTNSLKGKKEKTKENLANDESAKITKFSVLLELLHMYALCVLFA